MVKSGEQKIGSSRLPENITSIHIPAKKPTV